MVNTVKFSLFASATLSSNANKLAGYNSFSGTNVQADKVTTWTTLTRPTPPFDGLLGYNTTLEQYEYWNATLIAWVQIPSGSIVDATYILQTPNALLPNAQALSALTTGILKSTTVTGVVSISATLTSIDSLTSAVDEMLYSTGVNTWALTGLTAFARTLLDDASAATMRVTLGLGTAATKAATDNAQSSVASTIGAFTIGHMLVAADVSGTAIDGGAPVGGGTVTSITAGTGLTATPSNPIVASGTISFDSIAANSLWVNNTALAAVPTVTALAALTKTDDTNVTLTLGGTPATALINAVSLTLGWTGQLSLARGGTNASLTAVNGGIVYSSGTALAISAAGSAGQLFQSAGAATPVWTTATYPATSGISGNILISDGTNWLSASATGIGSPLTTKGDLYTFTTVNARLSVGGTNGQILQVASGAATGLAWSTATFPSTATNAARILRANGTNWVETTSTFADTYAASGVLYANGANNVAGLATANNGLLTTNGSGVPSITALSGLGILAGLVKTVFVQTFIATGTYTPTTGMLFAYIEMVGGGGAGGGSQGGVSQTAAGGGGGSGSYNSIVATAATIGASQSVTIGAGGTPGAAGANAGGNGGSTSVGTIVVAGGGMGGAGSTSGTGGTGAAGGQGGTAGTGNFLAAITGHQGNTAFCTGITANTIILAQGADSVWGGGGPTNGAGNAGGVGVGYGAGGAGGSSLTIDRAGGAGSAGFVRIIEFLNQ